MGDEKDASPAGAEDGADLPPSKSNGGEAAEGPDDAKKPGHAAKAGGLFGKLKKQAKHVKKKADDGALGGLIDKMEDAADVAKKAGAIAGEQVGGQVDRLADAAEDAKLKAGEVADNIEDQLDGDEDDAEGAGGGGLAAKEGREFGFDMEAVRAKLVTDYTGMPQKERPRTWNISMEIMGFENVSNEPLNLFFSIKICHVNRKRRTKIRTLPRYTGAYSLGKSEPSSAITLEVPERIFSNKVIKSATYKDLQDHCIVIDMWQISKWSFNKHYGTKTLPLWNLATSSMFQELMIQKQRSAAEVVAKLKPYDVARFRCMIELAEVYDFRLSFDNWSFKLNESELFEKYRTHIMTLTLDVPYNRHGSTSSSKTCWDDTEEADPCKFFWAHAGKFKFMGTKTNLENQAFKIRVARSQPSLIQTISSGSPFGSAIFGMTSILDVSVFKGVVKALTKVRERFVVGELVGNVKCRLLSKGYFNEEPDIKIRPEQVRLGSMASQLDWRHTRYLCVRVFKCENLPVADVEEGTSDPYLCVTWDGMMQKSPIHKRTCRPVFNQCFYFPVRFFDDKVFKKRKNRIELLPMEMQSKGVVRIEVWDDDETSSEFLGAAEIDLNELLDNKQYQMRSFLGGPAKTDDDSESEDDPKPKKAGLDTLERVRIYEGVKEQLRGSEIPTNGAPLIKFEVYFCRDFAKEVRCEKRADAGGSMEWVKPLEEEWVRFYDNTFKKKYEAYFPDALGKEKVTRDFGFSYAAKHPQTRVQIPLPGFLCPIVVPEEMSEPLKLMHWIRCIKFVLPTKQNREPYKIPQWRSPRFLLNARCGAPQDHAVLLCCVLLAMKQDAYVCKGLVCEPTPDGKNSKKKEHSWVMTRSKVDKKTVTFWEVMNATRYHLPARYGEEGVDEWHQNDEDEEEKEAMAKDSGGLATSQLETEVPTSRVVDDLLDGLPALNPKHRKVKAPVDPNAMGRNAMLAKMRAKREKLAIAPAPDLMKEDKLVHVPYDTIEYVFNNKNTWGNLQNEHPACIYYDFNVDWQWKKFLTEEQEGKVVPLDKDVVIGPALRQHQCDAFANDIVEELVESIRMYRAKKGLDTAFDTKEDLITMMKKELDILEEKSKLDPDFCSNQPYTATTWSGTERKLMDLRDQAEHCECSPESAEKSKYQRPWKKLLKEGKKWRENFEENLPVRRGMEFTGHAIHFCTSQQDDIRRYLLEWDMLRKILDNDDERVNFVVVANMYPLISGILSLWFMIGYEVPVPPEK